MSLGKKDIQKNISARAILNSKNSKLILNKFLEILINKTKSNIVKFPNFGVFYVHNAPKRVGRNPRTGQNFKIPEIKKVSFKAAQKIKSTIN